MGRRITEQQREVQEFDLESKLQRYVLSRLRSAPKIYAWKSSDRQIGGISDIIACVDGRFVAIELKVKSNRPTALQTQFICDILDNGGVAGVAWNWGDVKSILKLCRYDVSVFDE